MKWKCTGFLSQIWWNLSSRRTQSNPEAVTTHPCPAPTQRKLRPYLARGPWRQLLDSVSLSLKHDKGWDSVFNFGHFKCSPNGEENQVSFRKYKGWRRKWSVFQSQKAKLLNRQIPVYQSRTGTFWSHIIPWGSPVTRQAIKRGSHTRAALLGFVWKNSTAMIPHSCCKYCC